MAVTVDENLGTVSKSNNIFQNINISKNEFSFDIDNEIKLKKENIINSQNQNNENFSFDKKKEEIINKNDQINNESNEDNIIINNDVHQIDDKMKLFDKEEKNKTEILDMNFEYKFVPKKNNYLQCKRCSLVIGCEGNFLIKKSL